MKTLSIITVSILAAIAYGILHDQITARICVEYFTIGHEDILHTKDPTLLGFFWGVVATWWVGLFLGIPLAFAALFGTRPKRTASSLIKPILILMGIVGLLAALSGFVGYLAASIEVVRLDPDLYKAVPIRQHIPFLTDLWIHLGSYFFGSLGGLILCIKVWLSRKKKAEASNSAMTSTPWIQPVAQKADE